RAAERPTSRAHLLAEVLWPGSGRPAPSASRPFPAAAGRTPGWNRSRPGTRRPASPAGFPDPVDCAAPRTVCAPAQPFEHFRPVDRLPRVRSRSDADWEPVAPLFLRAGSLVRADLSACRHAPDETARTD